MPLLTFIKSVELLLIASVIGTCVAKKNTESFFVVLRVTSPVPRAGNGERKRKIGLRILRYKSNGKVQEDNHQATAGGKKNKSEKFLPFLM